MCEYKESFIHTQEEHVMFCVGGACFSSIHFLRSNIYAEVVDVKEVFNSVFYWLI